MIFHLLLYASFSFKLIKYLLTYWIVFGTVYLHFDLLIFDILRIIDILRSSSSAPTSFSLKMFLFCPIFQEMFLPVDGENNS